MKIKAGQKCKFITPFDQYREYNNQYCWVLRPLTSKEADLDETGPMYKVELSDNTIIDVFEDELCPN